MQRRTKASTSRRSPSLVRGLRGVRLFAVEAGRIAGTNHVRDVGWKRQPFEDGAGSVGLDDSLDDAKTALAPSTRKDVDLERALEELRPTQPR